MKAMEHVQAMLGAPKGVSEPKDVVDDDLDNGDTPGGHDDDMEMPDGFMEKAGDLHAMAQAKGPDAKAHFAQALYNLMCQYGKD